jgi:lipopolysaccharide export system permease protein
MQILTRYVLTELGKVFSVALGGLTTLMIIIGVVREAASQNLPLTQVLQLIPYILPDALRVSIPVTLLLATTVVYGRMSGSNEVVATKSAGISPMALLTPAFIAAFLISLVTVWLNDLAVSWGRTGAQKVVIEAVEEIAYSMLRSQKCYSSERFSINVKRVEGRELIRPTISLPARGDSPAMTITAEKAVLQSDHGAGILKVILYDGTLDVGSEVHVDFPGRFERDIPLREASRAGTGTQSPSTIPWCDVAHETSDQREIIARHEQDMAAEAAFLMFSGDFDALADDHWKSVLQCREYQQVRLHRLMLEPYRCSSAGFSCLFFVIVGAPMAIRLRKSDFLTVFFLCFLPILVVYYPLLIYGIDGAKSGSIPPQAVWMGNLLLLLWGLWLLKRVIRY